MLHVCSSYLGHDTGLIVGDNLKSCLQGKEHAQRVLLCAWMADPSFSDTFFSITSSVVRRELHSSKEKWITLKQLQDVYGAEETEEMVNEGF